MHITSGRVIINIGDDIDTSDIYWIRHTLDLPTPF